MPFQIKFKNETILDNAIMMDKLLFIVSIIVESRNSDVSTKLIIIRNNNTSFAIHEYEEFY